MLEIVSFIEHNSVDKSFVPLVIVFQVFFIVLFKTVDKMGEYGWAATASQLSQ